MNMEENALIKYTFLRLLLKEFDIHIKETEEEKIALAKQCVEIYDTPEEFYEKTKWDKDNPEQSSFQYLEENKSVEKFKKNLVLFPYPVGRRLKKLEIEK